MTYEIATHLRSDLSVIPTMDLDLDSLDLDLIPVDLPTNQAAKPSIGII